MDATGSTNADLLAEAAGGAPHGSVLVADSQTAGRGRLGRSWLTPPGSALAVSVLLRPAVDAAGRLGWLPLLTGLAVLDGLDALASGVAASVKWPNDVLLRTAGGERKVAGVLVQAVAGSAPGTAVVVGIGVNVTTPADALPETATSLLAAGAEVDRERLLEVLLDRLRARYARWVDGEVPQDELRARCSTLGRDVVVGRPGGELAGRAVDVDGTGRLVVRGSDGTEVAVDAGDVTHLRPRNGPGVVGGSTMAP